MSGVIRLSQEGDLEQLCGLLSQLSPQEGEAKRDIVEEEFAKLRTDLNYYLSVYEEDGKITGTAMLLIQPNLSHQGRPVGHIENVVTDAAVRGKGIGRELIRYLVDFACGKGCYKVILNCTEDNAKFYEKCGFRRTGEIEMRYDSE